MIPMIMNNLKIFLKKIIYPVEKKIKSLIFNFISRVIKVSTLKEKINFKKNLNVNSILSQDLIIENYILITNNVRSLEI